MLYFTFDCAFSILIFQGTFLLATWRGIQVAVKMFGEDIMTNEDKVWVGPVLPADFMFSGYVYFFFKSMICHLGFCLVQECFYG